jgi:hypothetical protein
VVAPRAPSVDTIMSTSHHHGTTNHHPLPLSPLNNLLSHTNAHIPRFRGEKAKMPTDIPSPPSDRPLHPPFFAPLPAAGHVCSSLDGLRHLVLSILVASPSRDLHSLAIISDL